MVHRKPHSWGAPKYQSCINFSTMQKAQRPIAAWMRDVMERNGWSANQWSVAAKIGRNTVARAIRDDYPFVTSTSTLVRLAAAAEEELPSGVPLATDLAAIPSADVLEEVLQEVLDVLAPSVRPDPEVLALVAEAFRGTLAVLATDPAAASDPDQARLYARALSHRLAH